MKYKGFIIEHDANVFVNSHRSWSIKNAAGNVKCCSTLKDAKEWVDKNPIDDFEANFLFGKGICDILNEEGAKKVREALNDDGLYQGEGLMVHKVFATKAERNAYCAGVEDADGWCTMNYVTHDEYKTISRTR